MLLFVRKMGNTRVFDQNIEKYALTYGMKCLLVLVSLTFLIQFFPSVYMLENFHNNEKDVKECTHVHFRW